MSAHRAAGFGFALVALAAIQAPAQAAPASLSATGCEEQELSVAYPAEAFSKLLPPGFKLNTIDPAGLLAAVDMSVDHCRAVDGGPGADDFTAFVEVVPPAAYQQPQFAAYGLMLRVWSTSAHTVRTFEAWGFGQQAAAGQIDSSTGFDLLGNQVGSATVQSGGSRLAATTLFTAGKSIYAAGGTRAFAQDAGGALHIIDASWTDQTFQYGLGTLIQSGPQPLPLALPAQAYPVIAAHATDYALTLRWVQ